MNGNKRIAYNSVILFVRFCISTLIGLFASRFVLQALGASDFGLYNVIGGIVALLNVINATMVATTYRFIATELGKKEYGEANKVFNVSFCIHAVFSLLVLVLGLLVGLLYVNNILNIDEAKLGDARFVLIVSIITTSISTLAIPFNGLMVAYEKFTLTSIIDVITQLLRLGAIIFLLYSEGNHLRIYSLIMMIYILGQSICYVIYTLRHYYLIVKFKFYNQKRLYKEMLSFSVWMLYSSIANIGKAQGSTMILNFFFGTVLNASYAIGCQIANYIQVFANSLSSVAIPQITKSFSSGNIDRSMTLTCYISKYSFILMSLIAFPAFMDMDWLLSMWLKDVPDGASVFCRLIVLETLLGCLGAGIAGLVQAQGNIKVFQIVVYSLLFLGLPLSYYLYKIGYGVYTISIIYCVVSLLSSLLKLFMLKVYYKLNVGKFLRIAYLRIALIMMPMLFAYFTLKPFGTSTSSHLINLLVVEVILLISVLVLGLDQTERNVIRSQFQQITKR